MPVGYVVTGAEGFIGSHLVEYLLKSDPGCKVVALAQYQSDGSIGWLSSVGANRNLFVMRGDIRDTTCIRSAVFSAADDANNGVYLFNLAALVSVPFSNRMPSVYWEVNASAVLSMLTAVWGALRGFIQVSTSEVFNGLGSPYPHDALPSPVSLYGASKAAAEMLIRGFAGSNHGGMIRAVRLFNTFGPRQFPRAIIPKMIREALRVKADAGYRPRFGDPMAMRAFIPVENSCRALLQSSLVSTRSVVLQFGGNAEAIAMRDLWKLICEVMKIDPATAIWLCKEHMRDGFHVPCLQGQTSPELRNCDMRDPLVEGSEALGRMIDWVERHPHYASPEDYQ